MSEHSSGKDNAAKFVFVDADIRGSIVHLEDSFDAMSAIHEYPPAIQSLLGEFLAAALLLSDTIKFEGYLSLQATSQGPLQLIMAEATHEGTVRGIARLNENVAALDIEALSLQQLLAKGTLAVTIDAKGRDRYQSIVPLEGEKLEDCLMTYFQQSEQLNTYISLAAAGAKAAGLLIQQLPVQIEKDLGKRQDRWETVRALTSTLTATELFQEDTAILLKHLFAEDNIQLFPDTPVMFQCSCSEERMAGALLSIGEAELAAAFKEQPVLELTCEFCGSQYQIDEPRLIALAMNGEQRH